MSKPRKAYPSDVTDAEWEFQIPYPTLMRADAPQRDHILRDVFDPVRYVVQTGCQRGMLPHDLPPASAVYQQALRWVAAGVFEDIAHDLRMILRLVDGREAQPAAAVLGSRALRSTPESGGRAGYDGAKKRNGSEVHIAVDTLGHLLALKVTAANEQERAEMAERTARLREVTGGTIEVAFVDQGSTGAAAADAARANGVRLEVVPHTGAKRGFVLLPRRWVVERTFARLARDYERLTETLTGWHWFAFLTLLLPRLGLQSA